MFLRIKRLVSSQPNGEWRIFDREWSQLLINAVTGKVEY